MRFCWPSYSRSRIFGVALNVMSLSGVLAALTLLAAAPDGMTAGRADGAQPTWRAFPTSSHPRQVLAISAGGVHYSLSGWRKPRNYLCLRLRATGATSAVSSWCEPLPLLRGRTGFVMNADFPVPPTRTKTQPQRAAATFGVVADNVVKVEVVGGYRTTVGRLGHGAFLSIGLPPTAGARVRRVSAITRSGTAVSLSFKSLASH